VQCGGDRIGARCSDPTDGHAEVLGCYDDTHASRRKLILEPISDLLRQPLLHLGAASEQCDHPSQLGQAKNPLSW